MKIEIIEVDYKAEPGLLTLRDCGFHPGDVVEVSGHYFDGDLSIRVIRGTKFASIGNEVSISEHEYKVVEE